MKKQERKTVKQYTAIYTKKGFCVLPIVPNDKKPLTKNGYKDASKDREKVLEQFKKHPKANIAIATGKAYSGFWVLDVDKKGDEDGSIVIEHIQLITGKFNTRTVHTPSGGTHYYFKCGNEDLGCRTRIFSGVDIKGEGGYVLAPPSKINGNRYKLGKGQTEVKAAPELVYVFAKYGAKSIPPANIKESGRNDALFKYICTAKDLKIPKDKATEIALAANKTFQPPLDEGEVHKIAESAYGYPNKSNQLPFGDELEIVEKLNRDFAAIIIGGKYSIMWFKTDYKTKLMTIEFLGNQDFHHFFKDQTLQSGGDKKTHAAIWESSPHRRKYEGITFDPDGNVPEHIYNLWQGYGVAPKKGDCTLFLNFVLHVICGGNKKVYRYVIHWLANLVQRPTNRPHTALVLHGEQGVGKTFFANCIGRIFGRHFIHLSGLFHILHNFNAHLAGKCLVFVDEMSWVGQNERTEGIIKDRISGDTFIIEGKNRDAIEVPNYMHFIFASNSRNIIPTSFDSRRYVMLSVSNKRRQDTGYFDKLDKYMKNGGYEALLHYLQNFDIGEYNLRIVPQTNLLKEMKIDGMSDIQKFWYEKLDQGYILNKDDGWSVWIPVDRILNNFCHLKKIPNDKSIQTEFGRELKNLIPPPFIKKKRTINGKQVNCYKIPTLEKCRSFFGKLMTIDDLWE